MSCETVLTGLQACLLRVPGLRTVLAYEPAAFDDPPMAYITPDKGTLEHGVQSITTLYSMNARVVVRWTSNEYAALQVIRFIDSVPAAVRADPMLGGHAQYARVTDFEVGFVDAGNVRYHVVDFTVTIKGKTGG